MVPKIISFLWLENLNLHNFPAVVKKGVRMWGSSEGRRKIRRLEEAKEITFPAIRKSV
jgi:hypothetical protein